MYCRKLMQHMHPVQVALHPGPAAIPGMLHLLSLTQQVVASGQGRVAAASSTADSTAAAALQTAARARLQMDAQVCMAVVPELAAAGLALPADRLQARPALPGVGHTTVQCTASSWVDCC